MDLLSYINYHYIDETPEWAKNAVGMEPKPLFEIVIDLIFKIILMLLTYVIFFWGARLLFTIWRIHNEKLRELEELNRRMAQDEAEERLRPPSGVGEGDNSHNPEEPIESYDASRYRRFIVRNQRIYEVDWDYDNLDTESEGYLDHIVQRN